MSSRVAGALALAAAVLVAIALVTTAWWSGHPQYQGKEMEYKTAALGLRGATLCNTEGDGKCSEIPLGGGFRAAGIAVNVVGVLAILGLLALAIGGLRGAARRKDIARVALGGLGAVVITAIVFILLRPASADVPVGYGMIVFWLGAITGGAAGALTFKKPGVRAPRPIAAAPAAGSVDVLALFQDELRTGGEHALPPPPAFGQSPGYDTFAPPPPQQTYATPQPFDPYVQQPPPIAPPSLPADPYAAPPSAPPPAANADDAFGTSRLRPLYEAAPAQGGTGGLVPQQGPAPFASPPPATPATLAGTAPAIGATVIPLPPIIAPPMPPPRPKGASVAPPTRVPINRALPTIAAAVPPPPTAVAAKPMTPPMLPPPPERPSDAGDPGDLAETREREREPAPTLDTAEHTDATAQPFAEDTSPNMMPSEPAESTAPSAPAVSAVSALRRADVSDDAETVARERVSASDLDGPVMSSAVRQDQMPRDSVPTLTGETALAPPAVVLVSSASIASPPAAAPIPSPARGAAPPITLAAASPPPPTTLPAAATPDAVRPSAQISLSTAPDSLAPPTPDQVASSGPSPACPQCEAPMAWVEAHLRFYCKPCRMYF